MPLSVFVKNKLKYNLINKLNRQILDQVSIIPVWQTFTRVNLDSLELRTQFCLIPWTALQSKNNL